VVALDTGPRAVEPADPDRVATGLGLAVPDTAPLPISNDESDDSDPVTGRVAPQR